MLENLTPKNKTLREVYDVQNTDKTFFDLNDDPSQDINHDFICKVHESLMRNIDTRTGYRTTDVRVFRAKFKSTPAPYVKADMDLLLKWYNKNESRIHPFSLASIFHHKFEKIHPFMDGNGRTGRMLLNYILIKKGYPPTLIRKRNRIVYLKQLQKADESEITQTDPEQYKSLIKFVSDEMIGNYWNIFL